MIKANVIRNYTNIDDRSSSLYDSVQQIDLAQASFDFSRLIYLFLLQTLTSKVPLASPMTDHFLLYQKTSKASTVPPILNLPKYPSSFDYFHLTAEFTYEFIRGSKMSNQDALTRCERNITNFEIEFYAALAYTQKGIDT